MDDSDVRNGFENSVGYAKLLESVEADKTRDSKAGRKFFHDYDGKLDWVLARARHYAEKLNIDQVELLDAWEKRRDYWYMNYYQDANQPLIEVGVTRVFDTRADLLASLGGRHEFRCPACEGVSSDPYKCTAGTVVKGKACDWKAYGLFGCIGKGTFVFVKEAMHGDTFFTPLAWESGQ